MFSVDLYYRILQTKNLTASLIRIFLLLSSVSPLPPTSFFSVEAPYLNV